MARQSEFGEKLAALAELCITIGLNVQPNQELVISASLEASEFVRQLAWSAYQRGARSVTCVYDDPALIRSQLENADLNALDYAPEWLYRGIADALSRGAARLEIVGPYPDLLSGVAADRIVRAHRAMQDASREIARLTSTMTVNCSAVPFVTGSWARQVFPALSGEKALERLWDTVFDVTRVNGVDRERAWEQHLDTLDARRDALQSARFDALRLFDCRTDLTVGLATGGRWVGGRVTAANGVVCTPTIPSEEVFTGLDPVRADGHVVFSRPLVIGGAFVDELRVEFAGGAVTSVHARSGTEMFERLIASDEGARHLGEVGLVAGSSRTARTGLMFFNPLFDRNAASHVAFGQSTTTSESSMHIDCMLGHAAIQVDGIAASGGAVPVMRAGEFVL